jgi:hypothetical protein
VPDCLPACRCDASNHLSAGLCCAVCLCGKGTQVGTPQRSDRLPGPGHLPARRCSTTPKRARSCPSTHHSILNPMPWGGTCLQGFQGEFLWPGTSDMTAAMALPTGEAASPHPGCGTGSRPGDTPAAELAQGQTTLLVTTGIHQTAVHLRPGVLPRGSLLKAAWVSTLLACSPACLPFPCPQRSR